MTAITDRLTFKCGMLHAVLWYLCAMAIGLVTLIVSIVGIEIMHPGLLGELLQLPESTTP